MYLFRFPPRTLLVCALVVALSGLSISDVQAQQPVITSAPTLLPAGPDYATDVQANPWDMSNPEDIGPFPDEYLGWTISRGEARSQGRGAFFREGQFVGRTAVGGGNHIPLLFRGGADFITSVGDTPVAYHDVSTYHFGKLSLKMTLSASTGGQLSVAAFSSPYGASDSRARGIGFSRPRAGTHIYTVDLVTGAWTDERGNPGVPFFFGVGDFANVAWNSIPWVRGLLLRPISDANAAGVDVQVDWVRLTQRDDGPGAASMPVQFTGCDSRDYSVEVRAADETWDVIHTGRAGLGTETASVNYGVLPPGVWDLRVTCFPSSRAANGGEGVSSDAVSVRIEAPPVVYVLNPDAAGGSDFATDVLGNAWDMDSVSDVAAVSGITEPAIVLDGAMPTLQATAVWGDPAIELLNGREQVNTRRFKNLSFTLTLDTPFGLDGGAGEGSVARVFWGSEPYPMTTSQDILIWPGRNTYTIDLASLAPHSGLEHECRECPQIPWTAQAINFFRLDPHESTRGVTFRLGPVLLTADDEVAIGERFLVDYGFHDDDGEGSRYEARVFLDTDREPSELRLLEVIANDVRPDTALRYAFDPEAQGIAPGSYLVYIEISETRDGIRQTRGAYSTGALHVLPPR